MNIITKKFQIFYIVIGVICMLIASCNDQQANTTANMTALEKMELVFVGDYTQEEIKVKLDKVMIEYNMPITEENYSRCGSVLITLRKDGQGKYTEMQILDVMLAGSGESGITFVEQAALSVTLLKLAK